MKAITVVPLKASSAKVDEVEEPDAKEGSVLVETLAVGVCGTDVEIVHGDYGWAPPGHDRLVLGHESLGRVLEAPSGAGLAKGDLVVCIVRRPDPVPCYACAKGEWDACRNGQYTEHGIKELDGFMRERYRANPGDLVVLDPKLATVGMLLEPTTVVAKAWQQIEAVGKRSVWEPKSVLVVGAGPIGLLAALLGVQRGYSVQVIDQVTTGLKPDLVKALGATYRTGSPTDSGEKADIVIECTGVPSLLLPAIEAGAIGSVVCLTGISPIGTTTSEDLGAIAREMVLSNKVVLGSVNANKGHYEAGATALAGADLGLLERLVTRRVPIDQFDGALEHGPDDVKVVIEIKKP